MAVRRTLVVGLLCLLPALGRAAAPEDAELLKTLPEAELAIKDTVDHWGLPFADQVRRFQQAQARWSRDLPMAPADFILGVQHGLQKIARNKYWFKGTYSNQARLEAARNEAESFQVAVLPAIGRTLNGVTLKAGPLTREGGTDQIPAEALTIYRVGYVETPRPQYPVLYSGDWPDVLLPNAPLDINGTDLGLFWVDIRVPRDAKAGAYRGTMTVAAEGKSVALEVSLQVRNFKLPDRVPFPLAVWTSGIWPPGTKMPKEDYRKVLAMFLEHGLDPISVGKEGVSLDKLDLAAWDDNVAFCLDRGLQAYEIPASPKAPEKLAPLVAHIKAKGWMKWAMVYSNRDEPTRQQFHEENVPYFREMKRLYPELRVYLASQHHSGIDRACDIWMTDLSTGGGPAFAADHRGRSQLWFYYCHLPIHIDFYRPLVQAPNMLIDNEAVEHRLALWLAWKYKTSGMFIWAGNREWTNKAIDRSDWEKTGWRLTTELAKFPYGGLHNGNGFLLYPGPHPSIRLKVLRDGVEDYGYLLALKRNAERAGAQALEQARPLLSVPVEVLVGPHYFNRDPNGLLSTRTRIADMIEQWEQ